MQLVKHLETVALSSQDIKQILGKDVHIVLYEDLCKYRTIDDVFSGASAIILLFQSKLRYGHWTAIIKRPSNKLEFFNSYGGLPDSSLSKINNGIRKVTNQDFPYLSKLLYESPYELFYNEFQFQRKSRDIKTCGRHCIVRAFYKDLDIYQYKKFLDDINKYAFNGKMTYDYIVTNELNHIAMVRLLSN